MRWLSGTRALHLTMGDSNGRRTGRPGAIGAQDRPVRRPGLRSTVSDAAPPRAAVASTGQEPASPPHPVGPSPVRPRSLREADSYINFAGVVKLCQHRPLARRVWKSKHPDKAIETVSTQVCTPIASTDPPPWPSTDHAARLAQRVRPTPHPAPTAKPDFAPTDLGAARTPSGPAGRSRTARTAPTPQRRGVGMGGFSLKFGGVFP